MARLSLPTSLECYRLYHPILWKKTGNPSTWWNPTDWVARGLIFEAFKTVTAEKHDPDTNMQSISFCFQTFLVFFCRSEGKSFIHSSFSNSTLSIWIHSFLGFTGRSSSVCGEKEVSVLPFKTEMKEILFLLCQASQLKDCIKYKIM